MRSLIFTLFALLNGLVSFAQYENEELFWPRELSENGYVVTLYQPQLETLKGNLLTGRMALSVEHGEDDLIFGALWFDAILSTDLDERTAVLENLTIPKLLFPDIEDSTKLTTLKEFIINDLISVDMVMSIDRIIASVEQVDNMNSLESELNNKPPVIYYRDKATVLISIDGDPILEKVEKSELERIVNTPFFIVKSGKKFYLKGASKWYYAMEAVTEEWYLTTMVPKDVKKLAKSEIDTETQDIEESDRAPKIISVSTPSELIVSDGKLDYKPIQETSLLYVSNSENDIIMDINSQVHYILINGRWYTSKTLKDGEWQFMEPKDLPKDFINIPVDSEISNVRSSVAGTQESEEAMYEQYIPQTAEVDRATATVEVNFDGAPKFEVIEGTTMKLAVNSDKTVLLSGDIYYCVDEGVWFESKNTEGPWIVSDTRPEDVDNIPPSSAAYNVKYVYIYQSTPTVVYVGYTAGYYSSYMYGGVVVYGTGYYYHPWYGAYYYPRPVTYGYGVHYSPYSGWGFSVGVSYGWMTVHSYHHRAYWGPHGYHHGYRHGYHHGYHHGYNRGYAAGYARGRHSNNVYHNRSNGRGVNRTGNYNRSTPRNNNQVTPSRKPNNMYADPKGNVHKRNNNGNWQQQNKRPSTQPSTKPSKPSTKPSTQPSTRPSTQPKMENQYQNRNRGNSNYQNSRSAPSRSGPTRSAPSRGGGGGGRRR